MANDGAFMQYYNSTINPQSIAPVAATEQGLGGMDWLNNNAKGLGVGIQGLGLGLSAYDTFLGNSAKAHKKNMQLANQQIAMNEQAMKDKTKFNANWAKASNGLGRIV